MPASAPGETFRFSDFELDVAAYQLRRQGRVVRLERQPMDVLILLVERRRQLVSRADIVERLWGKDVFVDVDTGVHTAIRKIRQALVDSISAPAFVETVPSKGYRFVADVEVVSRTSDSGLAAALVEPSPAPEHLQTNDVATGELHGHESTEKWLRHRRRGRLRHCSGVATVVGASGACPDGGGGRRPGDRPGRMDAAQRGRASLTGHTRRAAFREPRQRSRARISGRRPHRGDQRVAAQIDPEHLIVKGRTLGYRGTAKTAAEIGQELSVDYLVESTIRAEGSRLRVTATLIRVRDQEHVWSQSYDRDPTSLLGLQQELSTASPSRFAFGCRAITSARFGSGRHRTRTPMTRISGDDTSRAGERRQRTRSPSRSTSVRSRSIRTMRLPGPALRLPTPRVL